MQIGNSVDRYLGEAGLPSLGVVVDAPVLAIVLLSAGQVVADHPVDSVSQLLYRTAGRLCLFRFVSVVPPPTTTCGQPLGTGWDGWDRMGFAVLPLL